MNKYPDPLVICFGEVLWDILPTGAVPGGAPMNVAYHLQQQRKSPAVITRIGLDEEGKKLQHVFSIKGIDTQYFQVDEQHGTGKVYAIQDDKGDMTYDIVKPVAWDFIEWENQFIKLAENAAWFVYGSLAARSEGSASTLFKLLEIAPKKVLDINLRPPHFNRETIELLLQSADLLKMNAEELELISTWFAPGITKEEQVQSLSKRFGINDMVITLGGSGAILFMKEKFYYHKGYKVVVADTVGSGDAFLSGLLASLIDNASPVEALEWASRMGAYIATRVGGCPDYDPNDVKTFVP